MGSHLRLGAWAALLALSTAADFGLVQLRQGQQRNVLHAVSQEWQRRFVTLSDSGSQLALTGGGRLYLAEDGSAGAGEPDGYYQMQLLGKALSYTVDLSEVGCSCNAALYLVSMPGQNTTSVDPRGCVTSLVEILLVPAALSVAAPKLRFGHLAASLIGPTKPTAQSGMAVCFVLSCSGDYYCGANAGKPSTNTSATPGRGNYCPEMDILEANRFAAQSTPHICNGTNVGPGYYPMCDWHGCAASVYNQSATALCPSASCTIDTRQPFQHNISFPLDPATGLLVGIQNVFSQGARRYEWSTCGPGTKNAGWADGSSERYAASLPSRPQLHSSQWHSCTFVSLRPRRSLERVPHALLLPMTPALLQVPPNDAAQSGRRDGGRHQPMGLLLAGDGLAGWADRLRRQLQCLGVQRDLLRPRAG